MPTPLYDAHNHLAAPELRAHRDAINTALDQIGLQSAVVNGTSPADWPHVLELAQSDTHIRPAIGLHPWAVNNAPENWRDTFLTALDQGAQAVGEIGLDQWIEGRDIDRQQDAFRWQLAIATERNLPVSIHCLRAIGPLMNTLRSADLPERGIHLHAYNGPVALIPELVTHGARFSFNGGQLKPKNKSTRAAIRAVPAERLLIETDAPDMLPPAELRPFALPQAAKYGKPLTHPANLRATYEAIAKIRDTSFESLSNQVAINFEQYFIQ